jgi:two-component system, OmpR family, sensor histidine kinase VicK
MGFHISIIVMFIITPALMAGVWFVAYVFFEEFTLLIMSGAGIVLTYFALLFAVSFRSHTEKLTQNSPKNDKESHFYEDLYTNSPVPYLITDERGVVTNGNASSARLFETTLNEIPYLNILHALQSEANKDVDILLSKMKAGLNIKEAELEITTQLGNKKWVTLSLHSSTTTNKRLLSLVDITEKKKVDIAKSEFASLVTHQLRTPVAAMRWNTELLAQTLPQPPQPLQLKYLDKLNRNIERMLDLINDFLSVSKLETGTFETNPETITLTTYFDSIIDEYIGSITEKRITVEKKYDTPNASITIDTRLFHIITSNLLSNAVKYTPNEGTIVFGFVISGQNCIVTVADTGIGIPSDDQNRLFGKFFRASNAVKHRTEGTGLGLYIVKQSVEKLGGTIELNSIEQQGTTFQITIPVS